MVAALPVVILRKRRRAGGARRLRVEDHDQRVGIGIRQRREQHAIEDAEHGARDTDAQGERQNGQDGDRPRAQRRSNRVPGVPYQPAH